RAWASTVPSRAAGWTVTRPPARRESRHPDRPGDCRSLGSGSAPNWLFCDAEPGELGIYEAIHTRRSGHRRRRAVITLRHIRWLRLPRDIRRYARLLRFRPRSAEACRTGCYAYYLAGIVQPTAGAGQDASPVG